MTAFFHTEVQVFTTRNEGENLGFLFFGTLVLYVFVIPDDVTKKVVYSCFPPQSSNTLDTSSQFDETIVNHITRIIFVRLQR